MSYKSLVLALLAACLALPEVRAQKWENLAATPPMGWNSWNTFAGNINERLIREMADAIVASGMQKAGYEYIVLDDCWAAKQRDADGNLVADPEKFPSGMKALGDHLHNLGFKFGIYGCAGTETCAGYPGGHEHEEQDARMYASWGVDYLKYDWCKTEGADPRQRYGKMRDALRAAGRPVVFSMCEWGQSKPWTWAEDYAQLWRTTGDITDCWDCKPPRDYLNSVKSILDRQADLHSYAGPGHWNDPDMLEVGNPGLTAAESRAHFTLWCMLASPLMSGNDVRKMDAETRAVLTDAEVIAIDQDPLGKQATRAVKEADHEIWIKPLEGGAWAVCVLNTSAKAADLTVDWKSLDAIDGDYAIRNVWQKSDAGTTAAPLKAAVDSHDVVLLRLTPSK